MDERTITRGAVLVTGTASGMGRACVLKLDQAGFRVFAGVRKEQEAAGSSPEVMTDAVLHALTAKMPRTRYPVGHRSRLLPLLPRELPTRLLDQVRFKLFGLPRQFGGAQ